MLTVENLSHSYARNSQYQVDNISFSIRPGEIFGFLGPNGAGKSTTQKILTGLLPLQHGRVEILEQDIRKVGRPVFNQIGVAFEQPALYKKLTGLENLRFYAGLFDVPTADPVALLRLFSLQDAINKKAGAYSKGMQQRLMLARSLINQPRLWFLDEPTSGLDPASAQMVKELIRDQKKAGTTIFLTTHDMHVAEELCDRVAFINAGKIVALDTPRELKLKHGEKVVKVEYRANGSVSSAIFNQSHPQDRQRLYQLMEREVVETIHSQEATLETVFITLTGKELV